MRGIVWNLGLHTIKWFIDRVYEVLALLGSKGAKDCGFVGTDSDFVSELQNY